MYGRKCHNKKIRHRELQIRIETPRIIYAKLRPGLKVLLTYDIFKANPTGQWSECTASLN